MFDRDHDDYLDPPARPVAPHPRFVLVQCEVCGKDSDWRLCTRCELDFEKEMQTR